MTACSLRNEILLISNIYINDINILILISYLSLIPTPLLELHLLQLQQQQQEQRQRLLLLLPVASSGARGLAAAGCRLEG